MTPLHRSFLARSPVARAGLASLLAAGCGVASATEFGTVTTVTPAQQQVSTPSRECWQQQQLVQQPTTGGGAVTGAVVGGVIGHGLGGGPLGTALGAVIGAGVGNDAEAANTPPAAYTTTRCRNVSSVSSRQVYDVQYDYDGQHYSVKMATDPGVGAKIPLDVTAQGALPPSDSADAPPPAARQPNVVYAYPAYTYAYPAYGYYGYYGYPAVSVGIAPRVWIGGGWGWGWRRWR